MNCDPSALMEAAKCYQCISPGHRGAVMVYLECQWANATPEPPVPVFSYTPSSVVFLWGETPGGLHFGDLAAFNATATIPNVTSIFFGAGSGITSVTGLQALTALQGITLDNNLVSTLDASNCTSLTTISIIGNPVTSINVAGCTALQFLTCSSCPQLPSIDTHGLTSLSTLDCSDDALLVSLNASGCTSLSILNCYSSPSLSSVNASGCSALSQLDCHSCNLGTLNITGDFAITTLDFSSNPAVVIIGP